MITLRSGCFLFLSVFGSLRRPVLSRVIITLHLPSPIIAASCPSPTLIPYSLAYHILLGARLSALSFGHRLLVAPLPP